MVVWWATPVEIASAIARLLRMQHIDSSDCANARKLASKLAESWSMIRPSDSLRTKATQLVERYDLRAADSLQLAAAMAWCEDAPRDRVFLAIDQKLREAALLAGFDSRQI